MIKKAIFFDVDGTQVASNQGVHVPSDKTRETITKMHQLGHIPVVSTGRPITMLDNTITDMDFAGYICSAGAYVVLNGKVIVDSPIPSELTQQFFDAAIEKGIFIFAESTEYVYTPIEQLQSWQQFFEEGRLLPKDKVLAETNISDKRIYKLFTRSSDISAFSELKEMFKNSFRFNTAFCKDDVIGTDVIYNKYSKATGIKAITNALHIKKEDTYAIGDGTNDIEMFEVVGCGIAMDNAAEELKEISTFITTDVANEGIYQAFSKMNWMK
ncbi:MAG: HAD family hydrolase [Coprobacillaceae bacterium]